MWAIVGHCTDLLWVMKCFLMVKRCFVFASFSGVVCVLVAASHGLYVSMVLAVTCYCLWFFHCVVLPFDVYVGVPDVCFDVRCYVLCLLYGLYNQPRASAQLAHMGGTVNADEYWLLHCIALLCAYLVMSGGRHAIRYVLCLLYGLYNQPRASAHSVHMGGTVSVMYSWMLFGNSTRWWSASVIVTCVHYFCCYVLCLLYGLYNQPRASAHSVHMGGTIKINECGFHFSFCSLDVARQALKSSAEQMALKSSQSVERSRIIDSDVMLESLFCYFSLPLMYVV
jgi:hypothetical protein